MEDRNSEKFRKECEARYLLKMPREKRQEYYRGVEEKRGAAAAQELVAEVKRQYRLRERETALEV